MHFHMSEHDKEVVCLVNYVIGSWKVGVMNDDDKYSTGERYIVTRFRWISILHFITQQF